METAGGNSRKSDCVEADHPGGDRPICQGTVSKRAESVVSPCPNCPIACQGNAVVLAAGNCHHAGEPAGVDPCQALHPRTRAPVAELAVVVPSPPPDSPVALQCQTMLKPA